MRCYDCEKVSSSLFPAELEIKNGIHITAYVCWNCHKARRTKEEK